MADGITADWLTALSIIVATATWLVTYFRDRRAHQVAHTVDVIAGLSVSDRLAESTFQVTRLINSGKPISLDDIDPKTESHVVDILDYYEFLAELCGEGVLNRKTIESLRGRLMRRTWNICEPYIAQTRALQRRKVYSGFGQFVKDLPFPD